MPLPLEPVSEERREEASAFFATVHSVFEAAAHRCGVTTRIYSIGGYRVRLRFAGPPLLHALTPAFEHLRLEDEAEFDLTIGLWDSASTGTRLPPPPWGPEDILTRTAVRNYVDTRIRVAYEPVQTILSVLDTDSNEGFFWIRDAAQLPLYQCGSPLLVPLHQWMSLHGRILVHGGAVGTAEGGVLLVGKGGSGKSTAALCCLGDPHSPLLYAADDYGLVRCDPQPHFYSLYNSGKVNAADAHKHPLISSAQYAGVLDSQKALYFLHAHFPEKISTGFPLRAIVLPRVTGQGTTRLSPASQAQAMLALAPSTLFQLPGSETSKFQGLGELVRSLPCYVLESGTDWQQIPQVLGGLVAELNGNA